jgi:hypothetical protein
VPAINPQFNRPGIGAANQAQYRNVFKEADRLRFFPGGGVIDGASRDYGNAANLFLLRPGLLMGRVTSSKKWKPSIIGVNQNAYTSGGTTVTVTAAQAAEIVRRVGASGSLYYVGPPSAAGTVATLGPIAFSAVNTSTGAITTSSLGANLIAGGFVVAGDGSEVPRSLIGDGYGVEVPSDSSDVDWPQVPDNGVIESAKIIDWPTDTSLQAYIMDSLTANGRGAKFEFDHLLNPS